uniref:Ionotropic glutamate receptor C-terminal domain-containing protein n=1 Tax=Daphnia galeata TaxID=27404 RepID=A0A8J2WMX9_9CRUS|nr:unnamed protein product [Daphnia galeata]
MASNFIAIILIIWTVGYSSSTHNSHNPLNGQHLRVIWPLWKGNPKGLAGPLKGGVVLDYLAARLNFTYEMVRVTENSLEPAGKEKGLFNYLWNQESDFLLQDVMQTYQRNRYIDMSVPWIFGSFSLLMPVQDDTANVNAVIKPFQWPVWLGLVISIVCVIFVLNLLQRYFTYRSLKPETSSIEIGNQNSAPIVNTGNQYLYVFGNLLSQGVPSPSHRLSFRLVAAVWSLAAFIFVQAYTSTLITYVVTPINHPLVKSAYDLVEKTDVNVLVRKGGVIDTIFSNTEASQLLGRTLRSRINSFSKSRCSFASDCIDLLTPGSRNIFIDAPAYLMDAIREDFNKTRKCNLQLLKDNINGNSVQISLIALPKNSKFTKAISKAMLELMQSGIVDHWDLWFRPMPLQCLPISKVFTANPSVKK